MLLSMMSLITIAQTVEMTYHFDNPKVTQLRGYQQVSFEGCLQTALVGNPSLPYQMVSLMLPQGMEAESIEVELSDFQEVEGNISLFPYQPSRTVGDNEKRDLIVNEAIYASKSVYPAESHGVVTTQYKNGYGFANAAFTPVQYVPSEGKVMYAKTANVRVNTKASKADHSAMLWGSQEVKNAVRRIAQNPEMVDTYNTKGREVTAYDLLIITGQDFVEDYEEYCDYYNSIGLRNRIVTTTEVYSSIAGDDEQDKIRNYIIEEYQNNGIIMVVLGGDINIVPYRGFYCYVTSGGGNQESSNIPADLYYSGLDGTWNDNGNGRWGEPGEDDLYPEIGVSRMSFKTATELHNMIHKTLSYQQTPVLGEFQKVILAGEHLYDNPTSNGSDYLELLIGLHDDNGYTTLGYPVDYDFTKLYEEEGTWSGSALKQAINAGTSYVHHDGHANTGYVAGWYGVSNSDFTGADGTTHNYTFFHTQGCDCGAFDEDCILEKMVTMQNFAVAVIGNSRYGWFNEGQTEGPGAHLEREMTDAQWSDRLGLLSLAHADGKCMTAPWVTAPGQWEEGALRWNFYDMNILGDGAVNVWLDEPFTADVDVPSQVVVGTQSIEATVTDPNGNVLKGYRCLVYMDEEVIAMATTDENGVAEIEFEGGLQNVGNMIMKVLGVNSYPVIVEMMAVPSDTPYVVYDSYSLNGGAQIEFNGEYSFNMTLKNVGSVNANNVTATITCDSEYVTLNETTATLGDVAGNQSVTLNNAFAFTVNDNVPDNTPVRFNITCTDGTTTWESHFNARIYAPLFEMVSVVFDVPGGILNPGDSGVVHFTMKNSGGAAAPAAMFRIYNSHEVINIPTTEWMYDAIAAGSEFTADMNFTLDAEAEYGALYQLFYAALYNSYIINDAFYISVGQSMDGFETGDLSAYNWQYPSIIYKWDVVTENPYEGQYCAKSTSIGHGETSSLYITVEVGSESTMSFYYKVSSESGWDKLFFKIDGTEKNNWSGEIDWTQASYTLMPGTHELRWEYTKDVTMSSGEDCAWIDNVVFPPATIITDVKEVVEKQNVMVYPNPANDVLNIDLGDEVSDVDIFNSLGQMVRRYENISGEMQINVEDLKSGMYFVKIGTEITKVIKR